MRNHQGNSIAKRRGSGLPSTLSVRQLFASAGLVPSGPTKWAMQVAEAQEGVYVVALVSDARADCASRDVSYLPQLEQARWLDRQPVIYVGCTARPLKKRVDEFYRHKYGNGAPHSGGQAVKLLRCELWLYWAPCPQPLLAEAAMLRAFLEHVGRLPFANRRR